MEEALSANKMEGYEMNPKIIASQMVMRKTAYNSTERIRMVNGSEHERTVREEKCQTGSISCLGSINI